MEQIQTKRKFGISSFVLHIIAMALMLCDHMWATVIAGSEWMAWLGRITFPIFAFMTAEGYCRTSDYKKYMKRLLIFAVISEVPFNMMTYSSIIFPFHQNVLWTFLIALFCIKKMDAAMEKRGEKVGFLLAAVWVIIGYLFAKITMTDYNGYGVLTVILFRYVRGNKWYNYLLQLVGLVFINCYMMSGLMTPIEIFGQTVEIGQQWMGVLALIPVWLYNGTQGLHNKSIKYFFYAFYPVHCLILGLIVYYR